MVRGLAKFREQFRSHAGQYVLIGGAACDLLMEEVGLEFRATKDLDIVLSVEALNASFVRAFWAVVKFHVPVGVTVQGTDQEAPQVTPRVAGQVLRFCRTPRAANEIQRLFGLRHSENFQNNYLKPLLDKGWLERTIPDRPRSPLQRYRITAAGEKMLKEVKS